MDQAYDKEYFEGFDALWQRVQGRDCTVDGAPVSSPSQPPGMAETPQEAAGEQELKGQIRRASDYHAMLSALCRRWRNSRFSQTLSRMTQDAARHISQLEAAYYILTGDSCAPPKNDTAQWELPDALRELWHESEAMAAAYKQAAENPQLGGFSNMFRRLHADMERHSETLFAMIQSFMR